MDKEANIGDTVKVESYIGREVEGEMVEVNPYWEHDYGRAVPELLYIGRQARKILGEEDE